MPSFLLLKTEVYYCNTIKIAKERFSMEEKKETFEYTYSAKQQQEIEKIRSKYLPKQESKMEQTASAGPKRHQEGHQRRPQPGSDRLFAAGVWNVLHHGVGGAVVPSGNGSGADWHCRGSHCLSAVHPSHQKAAGEAGAPNPEADGRVVQIRISP